MNPEKMIGKYVMLVHRQTGEINSGTVLEANRNKIKIEWIYDGRERGASNQYTGLTMRSSYNVDDIFSIFVVGEKRIGNRVEKKWRY